jgi:hypothetical protein
MPRDVFPVGNVGESAIARGWESWILRDGMALRHPNLSLAKPCPITNVSIFNVDCLMGMMFLESAERYFLDSYYNDGSQCFKISSGRTFLPDRSSMTSPGGVFCLLMFRNIHSTSSLDKLKYPPSAADWRK